MKKMEEEISTYGVKLSDNVEEDITAIIGQNSMECSPHMKLFWEQQKKHLATNPKGRRYHPQFIRFCLSLHAKSSSAYRELQEVLVLPSERTLINYKNVFAPKPGSTTVKSGTCKILSRLTLDARDTWLLLLMK